MANSYIDYTGNGSLTTFTTPPYLAQAHLVVSVDGLTKTLGTDYTVNTNSTSLVFTTAPEASAKIRISRNSSQDERLTDYSNASLLTAEQMDTDANQLFYMAQEAADTAASTDFAAQTFYTSATTTPASGNVGDLFFNTLTGLLSVYSGTAWNAVNSRGDKQTFAISTSTTVFTPNNPVDGNTLVFLNGVLLVKGASSAGDYITTTTQVTLNTAVTSGVVEIVSFPNAAFVGTVNAVDGVFSGDITCNDLTTASLSLTYDSSSIGFNTPKTILRETGNGDFRIEGQDVLLRVSDGNVNFATGVVYTRVECTSGSTGYVQLKHGIGSTKLQTTATGIDVTGTVEADGFSGVGSTVITDFTNDFSVANTNDNTVATTQAVASYVSNINAVATTTPSLKNGQARVSLLDGTISYYQCVANGIFNDRDKLLEIFDFAKANMPCVVEFGVGEYSVTGGMEIKPAAGSRGLALIGASNGGTRFSFTKNAALTGNQFIMFAIKPAVEPTVGALSGYLRDIIVKDINFRDKYPEAHASFSLPSFTGGAGYTVGDSLAQASVAPSGGSGFTGTVTAVNGSGAITAFDITSDGQNYHNAEVITFTGGTTAATATVQSEESHAIKLRFTINASIEGCGCEDIGDEGFDLNYVYGGIMSNNKLIGTPSYGAGAALNVQFCDGVLINNNILQANQALGTRSPRGGTNGIGVEMVSQLPYDMLNITCTNNIIRDFGGAGIALNNSISNTSQTLSNILVSNNNINNCGGGVDAGVSVNSFLKNTIISNNVIKKVDNGIIANISVLRNINFIVANNVIEEVAERGIFAGGTGVTISDNNLVGTVNSAIRIGTASGVVISGGSITSCCSGSSEGDIASYQDGNKITVDGVQIINSLSSGKVIVACERVMNCKIEQASPSNQQIFSANEVKNNTMNGGINLDGNNYGSGMIIGNRIDTNNVLISNDAISLNSTNQSCIVSNNYIKTTHPASTHREGIYVASGSNNHVINGNITISETPASGIVNNGSGSVVSNNSLQ